MSEILACKLMVNAHDDPQKYEGKQYKVVDGSPLYSAGQELSKCEVHTGRLTVPNNSARTFAVYSDTMLEPIPQPVPFMHAAKIFVIGKTVICESKEFGKRKYTKKTKGARFEEEDGIPVSAYEILYGT
jgi:hypothetical protein